MIDEMSGKTSKRLETFDTIIGSGSRDPFVFYARAMELRALERFDEALLAYQEVEEKFPAYVPTYLMAGQLLGSLHRVDEARASFTKGVDVARRAGDAHALSELQAALLALRGEP